MRISDWSSDVFSSDLVEKPAPGTAPFNLILPGRYILQPEVMKILETQEKGAGGEIQLTDAMASMIGTQPFHGVTFDGRRFDCGSKAGNIERSEEHTSELQSLMRISYAVFCLKKNSNIINTNPSSTPTSSLHSK